MQISVYHTAFPTLVAFCCLQVLATEPANKSAEFVATEEWQVIAEGQAIPKGLHVRINLETGLKEAKLLDPNERDTAIQAQSNDVQPESSNERPLLEHKADTLPKSADNVKEYQNYGDLRKAYKDFQNNFRTDAELIVQLIEQYRNFSKIPMDSDLKSKLNALENLEYLLHQIDNALVFIDNGGLEDILLPVVVNDTQIDLRVSAMRVLGAMTGNNPKVQIKVFERNFGAHLSQVLMTSTNNAEISAALLAFGALLRKFPLAQQRVLSTSGTQALLGVLRNSKIELRNKAKVVTLIGDLILEKQHVFKESKDSSDPNSAVTQYVLLEFDSWLQSKGFCGAIDSVLSKNYANLLEQPDIVEQFTSALEATETLCRSTWPHSPTLRHVLLTLRNRFANSQNEYQLEVSQILSGICQRLFENISHAEL